MSARFISVEGVEGVGKTTCLDFVERYLLDAGVPVLRTREPGGSPNGERIRDLLLSNEIQDLPPIAELLLMFAARADHIANHILPALKAGTWVLTDRFTDSSFAYQGGGRGLDLAFIRSLESAVVGSLSVDRTFLLDLPPQQGRQRIGTRDLDRIEREGTDFFDRTRQVFLDRAASDPARFRVVDARASIEGVNVQLAAHLDELLEHMSAG